MIVLRSLCLVAVATAFLSTGLEAQVQEKFQEGVELLQRGQDAEALAKFREVLALDPSREDAFELWQKTEHEAWLKMLSKEGEFAQIAERLMALSSMGRKQRQNDPEAIRELVKQLTTQDVAALRRAVTQLAADYGEYAVPIMIHSLADQNDSNRRVNVMHALMQMGSDVVPPLIEALDSPDAFLRRNVALTLGYIQDPRARPALARLAATDPDATTKSSASQALAKVGGPGDAGELYIAQGDAYYREDDSVLMPHQYSDVVWHWEGTGLESAAVPRFLYAPEMAKRNYYHALGQLAEPDAALAGIARCAVTELQRLAEWQAAGQDVGDWADRLKMDDLAAQIAGPAALDVALGWALEQNDMVAASGLCRLLASSGTSSTANLEKALTADRSGSVRGEAAVALGQIAFLARTTVTPDTVVALGEAAGREVVRIGAVIDGDEARRRALADKLSEQGMLVNSWSTGARGLASLSTISGIDVLLVADQLPDLTLHQVVSEVRSDPRLANTPILVIASGADGDYGDKVNGVIQQSDDLLQPVEAALSEKMNRDREEANALAARAASTLWDLASGPTDVSSAAEALAGTLASRPDEVVLPALGALSFIGTNAQVERIGAVLKDGTRSEPIRVRAAKALADIFARTGSAETEHVKALQEVALSDASFPVRAATAGALGRLKLSRELRIELMHGVLGR